MASVHGDAGKVAVVEVALSRARETLRRERALILGAPASEGAVGALSGIGN